MNIETANRLFELRKKHGLSQEELAERLGVSRQAVSKWERSEASPDTDNLIALAKIYGLTLDELIYGAGEQDRENNKENKEEKADSEAENKKDAKDAEYFVSIDDGGDKVKIGTNGVFVEDGEGNKVKIGLNGIFVKAPDDKEYRETTGNFKYDDNGVHLDADGNKVVVDINSPKIRKRSLWLDVSYPIICAIAYLLCGFYNIFGGWGLSWIIFVTIPVYYSVVNAVLLKRVSEICYPVLCAVIYLYFGLYMGNWHPSWLVFVTIPVFYPIANAIDRNLRAKGIGSDNADDWDDDDDDD